MTSTWCEGWGQRFNDAVCQSDNKSEMSHAKYYVIILKKYICNDFNRQIQFFKKIRTNPYQNLHIFL